MRDRQARARAAVAVSVLRRRFTGGRGLRCSGAELALDRAADTIGSKSGRIKLVKELRRDRIDVQIQTCARSSEPIQIPRSLHEIVESRGDLCPFQLRMIDLSPGPNGGIGMQLAEHPIGLALQSTTSAKVLEGEGSDHGADGCRVVDDAKADLLEPETQLDVFRAETKNRVEDPVFEEKAAFA